MDETPTPSMEGRRRRLLFRATHMGTRENDILVGGFVRARVDTLSDAEIESLETILRFPDPLLADWLTGRAPIPAEHDSAMLRAMRKASGV